MTDTPENNSASKPLKKNETQAVLRASVFKAVRLIEERYDNPPTARELAKTVGVSIFHFHRAFRAVVGESIAQHILRLRVEEAASLLKYSSWQIGDIGLACGFQTQASFARGFKRLYGKTPMAFRKSEGTIPFLRAYMRSRPGKELANPELPLPTVRIETWPDLSGIALRFYGSVDEVHKPWGELLKWARDAVPNLKRARFFGLWFDNWSGNDDSQYRYECVIVPEATLPHGPAQPFFIRQINAGEVAVASALGTPEKLDKAWKAFGNGWLPFSGFQPRGMYAFDEYPADLVLASPLRQIAQGVFGSISIDMCLPIQKGPVEV